MGQKTSIYLPDDMAAKVKASGVPLIELVRRGLGAGDPESIEATMRRVLREESTPGGLHVNVLTKADNGTWRLVGSFDYRKAERFRGRPDRPGGPQDLYRTSDGQWVLSAPAGAPGESIVAYTYITDDQARNWLHEHGHREALRGFAAVEQLQTAPSSPAPDTSTTLTA